jgi:hypothetical protein
MPPGPVLVWSGGSGAPGRGVSTMSTGVADITVLEAQDRTFQKLSSILQRSMSAFIN